MASDPLGPGKLRVVPSQANVVDLQKAAELIADHVRRDIALGKLRDGDALPPEGELLRHFNVSRPTLRSAFRILESESLLTITRGKLGGPRVRHPGAEVVTRNLGLLLQLRGARVGDLFRLRTVLEPSAAFLLAEQRPPDGLRVLEALIVDEEDALAKADYVAFAELAVEFYRAVTLLCGNEILALFGAVVHLLLPKPVDYLFRTVAAEDHSKIDSIERVALADYRQLVQLVRAGDAGASERLWRSHLEWVATSSGGVDPTLEGLPFTAFD